METGADPRVLFIFGALAFAETATLIGFFLPGELAVIAAGALAGRGSYSPALAFVVCWACAFAGDVVGYTIGRRYGRTAILLQGRRLGVTVERLERVESYVNRYGILAVLIGRFTGFVRPLMPLVMGSARMTPARFVAIDIVATAIWAAVFVGVGVLVADNLEPALNIISQAKLGVAALLVVGGAVWLVRRRRRLSG